MEGRALLSSGTLDSTFSGTGTVVGSSGVDTAVLVQPADGKIVTAGYSPGASGYNQFALARYNPNGTIDPSFGSGGQVITSVASNGSQIHGAALQADGKIVAVGEAFVPTNSKFGAAKDEIAVVRYTASGALDATFGGTRNKNGTVSNAGEVFLSLGSGKDVATAVALETVNNTTKIVVAGWTNSVTGHPEIVLVRLNLDGSFDTSFGGTGKVVMALPGGAYSETQAVAIQGDGKIVAAGLTTNLNPVPAFLVRYNVNGSLDTTFGNQGAVLTHFARQDDFYGVTIQSDGKVVAAGDEAVPAGDGYNTVGLVARYNPDGTLDATFGGGTGTAMGPGQGTNYYAVALQANGQIVAAGSGANSMALVSRFNPDGSPDTAYGSGGSTLTPLGVVAQYNAVAVQPSDGNAVAAGLTSSAWPSRNHLVARYTASTTLSASLSSAIPTSSTAPSPTVLLDPSLVAPAPDGPDLWDLLGLLAKRRGQA
jgi:uncharacterized delta-60 repeat protein